MAITVGQAKQYAVDACYSMTGTLADEIAVRFLRQALQRLSRAHPWTHYAKRQRITLDPEEDGTATVAAGGTTITSVTTDAAGGVNWPSKYAETSEAWDIILAADTAKAFRFATVATTTGTLATGQKWTAAAVTAGAFTARRFRYSLPDDFTRGHQRIQDLTTFWEVEYVPPATFDAIRTWNANYGASQPEIYTLRDNGYIEFFPAPGSSYGVVELSFTRKPTLPTTATTVGTSVDWPEDLEALLYLAIEVEAARWQGKAAQIPYAICAPELERAIGQARAMDTDRGRRDRTFTLNFAPGPGRMAHWLRNSAAWTQV